MACLSGMDARCGAILDGLVRQADALGVEEITLPCGARLLDAGVHAAGSLEAGARMTELCQGGFGSASITLAALCGMPLPHITVETRMPKLAALTLQSAMPFSGAMISGPVKLFLSPSAEVTRDLPVAQVRGALAAVVQADELPDDQFARTLAERAGCAPEQLTLICAPQDSVAGSVQIAGRMNENVIFTMERSLSLDAACVSGLFGGSPVCPVSKPQNGHKRLLPDDFLHYAAGAYLTLCAPAGMDGGALAHMLTFESTDIFGRLFSDLLEQAGGDFFKIPNLLHINKLACITINDVPAGVTYTAGGMHADILVNELV